LMTVLSIRFKAACSALVAGPPGLGFAFALKGLDGAFSDGPLDMPQPRLSVMDVGP
jgi:hypothetical protein